MEYQILLEMIKQAEYQAYEMYEPARQVDLAVVDVLIDLKMRIDKAREADIIAMSNEGCI
jgi:hypothetical protein